MATLDEIFTKVSQAQTDVNTLIATISGLNDTYTHNVSLYNDFFDAVEKDITLADSSVVPNYKKLSSTLTTVQAPDSLLLEGKSIAQITSDIVTPILGGVRAQLDTLKKLAQAINEDPNYHTTVTTLLAGKLDSGADAVNALKLQGKTVEVIKAEVVAYLTTGAAGVLDTINELREALNNDPDFATNMTKALAGKQATLESGTNIKTINGESVLGAGNIVTIFPAQRALTHLSANLI